MKKSKAIVLGIFTIIPVLYLVFFITFFVGMLFKAFGGANPNPPVNLLLLIFPIHFLMMILLISFDILERDKSCKYSAR